MFEHDQYPGLGTLGALVGVVDQHRALGEKPPVALEHEIDDSGEQRVAGGDQLRRGRAGHPDEVLVEGDPLVPGQHRDADSCLAVSLADGSGDGGDGESARFPLHELGPQVGQSGGEEPPHVVGLEALGRSVSHLDTDPLDVGERQGLGRQWRCSMASRTRSPMVSSITRLIWSRTSGSSP